ncbi:hypothetical protein PK28_10380 [Hymenobacter sp. DG25B]|uniref:DUF2911 domain-containing protein n=1 Tax=Hymenobacter sp. DG25B TaxID=1385664 RepID=UPI000540FCF0|nr:DUF2911 domain-containing protein [Hymenobacter sp. DG25B]AIZ63992.1 hypothetical protein PK28_10380 [Hymenobacter sp. DG25B]
MKNTRLHFAALCTLWLGLLLLSVRGYAQDTQPEDKSKRPSPPAVVAAKTPAATISIDYSRPSVRGRKIFGELVPLGQVWRTGANEATMFTVDKNVKIEGKPLPAGKYSLFTIPGQDEWTIIFNKVPVQWGAFKYDEKQDALRVNVKPQVTPKLTEQMTFTIDKSGKVSILWENTQVDFMVSAAK